MRFRFDNVHNNKECFFYIFLDLTCEDGRQGIILQEKIHASDWEKNYLIILFLLCIVETFLFFDFMRKKPLSSIYHQAFVEIKTRHFCDRKKSVCISVKDADKTLFSSCTIIYIKNPWNLIFFHHFTSFCQDFNYYNYFYNKKEMAAKKRDLLRGLDQDHFLMIKVWFWLVNLILHFLFYVMTSKRSQTPSLSSKLKQ